MSGTTTRFTRRALLAAAAAAAASGSAFAQTEPSALARVRSRGRLVVGVYNDMPPFEGILNQEATWAIKAYLETRREKPL